MKPKTNPKLSNHQKKRRKKSLTIKSHKKKNKIQVKSLKLRVVSTVKLATSMVNRSHLKVLYQIKKTSLNHLVVKIFNLMRVLKHPRNNLRKMVMRSMMCTVNLINGFIMAVAILMSFKSNVQVWTARKRREK